MSRLLGTGTELIESGPWGTHVCVCYGNLSDLLDILITFFKAGLSESESGLWITPHQIPTEEVCNSLRRAIPNIEKYLARRQMEVIPPQQWYLKSGRLKIEEVLDGWRIKMLQALERGYNGIRITGDTSWLKRKDWKHFLEYERALDRVVEGKRMIVLCTYSLRGRRIDEMMDAVQAHGSTLIKRKQTWEHFSVSQPDKTKEALQNAFLELQEQLEERSVQVEHLLKSEQQQRSAAEERQKQLQILSRRLVEVQESERRKIARELHDAIGQELTAIKLQIELLGKRFGAETHATKAVEASVNGLIERVRDLSLNLRPTMLDDLGLIPALLWLTKRYSSQTEIKVELKHKNVEGKRFLPETETTAYRVVQEALTNIARHSGAKEAFITVEVDDAFLRITIKDQGCGFDADSTLKSNKSAGLSGMIERAESAGGKITISSSSDSGTTIHVALPIRVSLPNPKKVP